MPKSKHKIDTKQLSIFEYLQNLSASQSTANLSSEGQFKIVDRLRAAIRSAIKSSPLSRHQIAGEMSHLLGESISKEQIDSWTREDQEIPPTPLYKGGEIVGSDGGRVVRRYIPAEYLPAFCQATGCNEPLVIMGRMVGLFVLPGPEALRAEIRKIDEQINAARERKRQRVAFLRGMENQGSGAGGQGPGGRDT